MRGKRVAWAAVALLVLAAAGRLWTVARAPLPDDRAQILNLLNEGRQDLETRRIGRVTGLLSVHFQDASGLNRDQVHLALLQSLRGVKDLRVRLDGVSVQVQGRRAHVDMTVTVDSGPRADGGPPLHFTTSVSLSLEKEPAHRLLFFPTTRWRITAASGYDGADLSSLVR